MRKITEIIGGALLVILGFTVVDSIGNGGIGLHTLAGMAITGVGIGLIVHAFNFTNRDRKQDS